MPLHGHPADGSQMQDLQRKLMNKNALSKIPEVKTTCYKLYCFKTALDSDKLLLHTWF